MHSFDPFSCPSIRFFLVITTLWGLLGCEQGESITPSQLVEKTIAAHGGAAYQGCEIEFQFRDKQYGATLGYVTKSYGRAFLNPEGDSVLDIMDPNSFQRFINNSPVRVVDTMAAKYRESINSVWYFALLPQPLQDPAVRLKGLGTAQIGEITYHKLEVRFTEEGGGKDFQDVYVYWIHPETYYIDYLAYSFVVNGGGLRFRKAYNRRQVGGITFQDYVNYKADPAIWEVQNLDRAFNEGALEELSRIELESIQVSPIKSARFQARIDKGDH